MISRRPLSRHNRGRIASGGAWSPTQIGGLTLWVRSDLGIMLNGSNVAAWADQSGAGNHLLQGTPAAQGAYVAADANLGGHPSLSFAANQYLAGGPAANIAWLAVVATYPATTFADYAGAVTGSVNPDIALVGNSASADWYTAGGAVAGTRYRNGLSTITALTTANRRHLYEFEPSVTWSPAGGALWVGNQPGGAATRFWPGGIAEVFAASAAPSVSTKTSLLAYVNARYP